MVTATVGNSGGFSAGGGNTASFNVTLLDERPRSTDEVVSELRGKLNQIPEADITIDATSGLATGSAVQINLQGDDIDVLRELSENLVSEVSKIEGVVNATSSLDAVREEYEVLVNKQVASQYGLSASQILSTVRTSFNGSVATSFRTGDDQIDVQIALPKEYQQDFSYLENLRITTAQGIDVPLLSVATLQRVDVPQTITRNNQVRQVEVTAGADANANAVEINQKVTTLLNDLKLPEGYTVDTGGGQQEQMMESFTSLAIAILLSVVLIYMVMAGQFESLFTPFVIMFSIPPTLIGVIIGLVVTGTSLSITAFTGYIMLAGLVVNNAIIMIDFIIQLRQQNMERDEAILLGSSERLRPVMMTTLSTVLAMLPMMLSSDSANAMMAPMAVVVVFGLSFASVITLVLIPVVYLIFDNMIEKRKNRKLKRQQKREAKLLKRSVQV